MKPYQPSNKVTSNGLLWMSLSSIVGGGIIGGLTHLISQLFYLVLLFPLGIGLAGGGVMALAIRQGKVRNPGIAILFGILTGVITYGSINGAGYLQFQKAATEEITQEFGDEISKEEVNQLLDAFLQDTTGTTGFWGYMKYSAQEGISIGRFGRSGFNLGATGTWIYWAIEFAIIDIIIAAIAASSAKDPFCESCDQWYEAKGRVGSVSPEFSSNFLDLLQQEHLNEAGKLVNASQAVEVSGLEVCQQKCTSSQTSNVFLIVEAISQDNKGNLKRQEVEKGMVSVSQYHKFQQEIVDISPEVDHSSEEDTPEES